MGGSETLQDEITHAQGLKHVAYIHLVVELVSILHELHVIRLSNTPFIHLLMFTGTKRPRSGCGGAGSGSGEQ